MLEAMLGIQERYLRTNDREALQIELLDVVPTLKRPGLAGMGDSYRNALTVYNTLREDLPLGTPGIPELRSNRI